MRELFDEVAGHSPLDPEEAVRRTTRGPRRKRFYAQAGVAETPKGFGITLDGKPVRTPSRRLLAAPTREIAEAIAAEWDAQKEIIDPDDDADDAAGEQRDRCGRRPRRGRRRRHRKILSLRHAVLSRRSSRRSWWRTKPSIWDPVLFWAADTLGAHFILTEGIVHVRQPDQAVAAARAVLPDDPWSIAALHVVTTVTGSALLALALMRGALDEDQVWAAAHVDEDWNVAQWGVDEEVAARRLARFLDFRAAARVLEALDSRRS